MPPVCFFAFLVVCLPFGVVLFSFVFFVLAVTSIFYELIKDMFPPVVCLTKLNVTRYWLKRYGHKRPGAWKLFQWIWLRPASVTFMYLCIYSHTFTYQYIYMSIYPLLGTYTDTHTCIDTQIHHVIKCFKERRGCSVSNCWTLKWGRPGIQVVHRCLYLLSGWFPKYVDQSGAPNQQGLFRGLAVTWRQAHVLAEAQTLLTAARHGLAMILWTRSVWNSVLTWSCCEISELLYGGDLLKVGKQLESTYFGVWWTTRVWLQYLHIFSRWGSGKSMFRFIFLEKNVRKEESKFFSATKKAN